MSFAPKVEKTPKPAYAATTADANADTSVGGMQGTLLARSLPSFTVSGLTSTARSGRKSLLGSA